MGPQKIWSISSLEESQMLPVPESELEIAVVEEFTDSPPMDALYFKAGWVRLGNCDIFA